MRAANWSESFVIKTDHYPNQNRSLLPPPCRQCCKAPCAIFLLWFSHCCEEAQCAAKMLPSVWNTWICHAVYTGITQSMVLIIPSLITPSTILPSPCFSQQIGRAKQFNLQRSGAGKTHQRVRECRRAAWRMLGRMSPTAEVILKIEEVQGPIGFINAAE